MRERLTECRTNKFAEEQEDTNRKLELVLILPKSEQSMCQTFLYVGFLHPAIFVNREIMNIDWYIDYNQPWFWIKKEIAKRYRVRKGGKRGKERENYIYIYIYIYIQKERDTYRRQKCMRKKKEGCHIESPKLFNLILAHYSSLSWGGGGLSTPLASWFSSCIKVRYFPMDFLFREQQSLSCNLSSLPKVSSN